MVTNRKFNWTMALLGICVVLALASVSFSSLQVAYAQDEPEETEEVEEEEVETVEDVAACRADATHQIRFPPDSEIPFFADSLLTEPQGFIESTNGMNLQKYLICGGDVLAGALQIDLAGTLVWVHMVGEIAFRDAPDFLPEEPAELEEPDDPPEEPDDPPEEPDDPEEEPDDEDDLND
jgi:hypothetical protein